MSTHGPAARILIGSGLLCGLIIALASSVVLHGASLVAVAGAAGLAACMVYRAHEGRAAARAAAWKAAGGTVAVIMLVAGVVVLTGAAAAVVVSGLAAVVAGGTMWLRRVRRGRSTGGSTDGRAPRRGQASAAPPSPAGPPDRSPGPVSLLPISVLGREWSRTTAALASSPEPAELPEIVRRRQELLDELERRDPAGFARWLAAVAATDNDPATFVRGERPTGSDAT